MIERSSRFESWTADKRTFNPAVGGMVDTQEFYTFRFIFCLTSLIPITELKNKTKRVDDAVAAANSKNKKEKRPRITDQRQKISKEQAERARLMRVDQSVWDMINAHKAEIAKREAAREGDPLSRPYKTERERLLLNKQAYAGLTIMEAFAKAAGKKLRKTVDRTIGNETPTELHIGDIISLQISSVSKNGVVFDSGCYKENFVTRNNFAHFPKLLNETPAGAIKARVVEMTNKGTMVDVFGPITEDYILPRAKEPWVQNLVEAKVQTVEVTDLHLVRGGYVGKAIIPSISEFVGEPFMVDAFIPGSQIVLNTTDDFEAFEGATVKAFIMSYAPKPNGRGMSLVCSRKNYLKHLGNLNLKEFHKIWCDAGEEWDEFSKRVWGGKITGVLNSAKKCGVFVEIKDLNITGMIPTKPEELVNYKAGEYIPVVIRTFDEEMVFNDSVGQMQHLPAFEIVNGAIKKINIKPILAEVGDAI